jgi:hypothetical protein
LGRAQGKTFASFRTSQDIVMGLWTTIRKKSNSHTNQFEPGLSQWWSMAD